MLKITTYNVLADAYIRPGYFPHTPPEILEPRRRREALLRRMEELGAHLLCLQEVERSLFEAIQTRLPESVGHYLPKGRGKPDGCAIFAAPELSPGDLRPLAYGDGSGHVALSVELKLGGRALVVTTTHLKWAPPELAPEAHQGWIQLQELLRRRAEVCGEADGWVVCGDLNATPDHALLGLAAEAGLQPAHPSNPPTCNVHGWARTLDYLLVSPALAAEPEAPPSLSAEEPMPSSLHPSDHLSLSASLEWR